MTEQKQIRQGKHNHIRRSFLHFTFMATNDSYSQSNSNLWDTMIKCLLEQLNPTLLMLTKFGFRVLFCCSLQLRSSSICHYRAKCWDILCNYIIQHLTRYFVLFNRDAVLILLIPSPGRIVSRDRQGLLREVAVVVAAKLRRQLRADPLNRKQPF